MALKGDTKIPKCIYNLRQLEDLTLGFNNYNLYTEQIKQNGCQMELSFPDCDSMSNKRKLEIVLMGYECHGQ